MIIFWFIISSNTPISLKLWLNWKHTFFLFYVFCHSTSLNHFFYITTVSTFFYHQTHSPQYLKQRRIQNRTQIYIHYHWELNSDWVRDNPINLGQHTTHCLRALWHHAWPVIPLCSHRPFPQTLGASKMGDADSFSGDTQATNVKSEFVHHKTFCVEICLAIIIFKK